MFKFLKNDDNTINIKNIDKNNIPKHIAIIMDGNGRWAKLRNLPRIKGHLAGAEAIRNIVKACSKIGVKYLTLYAFSTENWKRSNYEVSDLMHILKDYLKSETPELNSNNVIINCIGDISGLPSECRMELVKSRDITKNNTGLTLTLALNYGGRSEIVDCIKKICSDVKDEKYTIESIDEKLISNNLYTKNMPDPDFILRPSGEKRLSNFLLYQCAYSEFISFDINWPDFKVCNLYDAIIEFQKRNRRYGGR